MAIIETILSIIAVCALVFMTVGGVWGYFHEKKWWNGGICPLNNQEWIYFDTDSQGGRGYKTPDGAHTLWVSWPRIDKNRRL